MRFNPISRLRAYQNGEITLNDRQIKHCLVWDKLFKNGDFFDAHINAYPNSQEGPESDKNTNVMLVSPWLKDIYEGKDLKDEDVELVLVSLDWSGDSTCDRRVKRAKGLGCCLRMKSYDTGKCEVTIQDCNWKLNIWQWAREDWCTAVTNVTKLLYNGRVTYLMFAEDDCTEDRLGWGVWKIESQVPIPSDWPGFSIPCPIYFHMGRVKTWGFFEWNMDGGRDLFS